jgi:hypothetical protein
LFGKGQVYLNYQSAYDDDYDHLSKQRMGNEHILQKYAQLIYWGMYFKRMKNGPYHETVQKS